MKIPLILVFLFFSYPLLADDISDFEIEGISVGESLLDYMSEEEINKNKMYYLEGKRKFYVVSSGNLSLDTYESLEIYLKTDDKKYVIYALSGAIFYKNEMAICIKKKDELVNNIEHLFQNSKKIDSGLFSHQYDKSGLSKVTNVYFSVNSDTVLVGCLDWSEEIERKNWMDNLFLKIETKEIQDWVEGGYK